jgi:hypothetical protein
MTIDKVLAVYKTTPIVLVVEPAEGIVCELSLRDLRGGGRPRTARPCHLMSGHTA